MVDFILLPGLHGNSQLATEFLNLQPDLFEVTALSYPKDGPFTYEALVKELLPFFDHRDNIVLIGESFGGPLSVLLASRINSVIALILVGSFLTCPAPRWTKGLSSSMLKVLPMSSIFPRMALAGFSRKHDFDQLLKKVLKEVSVTGFINRVEAIRKVDVREECSLLEIPLLYLQAKDDFIVPSRCGKEVIKVARQATLERITGAHMLLETNPKECWNSINTFIQNL